MEIVSDHLCHFPSKSLFGGMCKIKFPFPDLDLLGWYPTTLVFPWSSISFGNKSSTSVKTSKNEKNTAILGKQRSVEKIELKEAVYENCTCKKYTVHKKSVHFFRVFVKFYTLPVKLIQYVQIKSINVLKAVSKLLICITRNTPKSRTNEEHM